MLSKFTKIFSIVFLSALILSATAPALAATIEVRIPGITQGVDTENIAPGAYIRNFFVFGFSFIGFLAVAMIVYGGILYAIPNQTSKAKEHIRWAIYGILLLFGSYLILYTIDPELVDLTMPDIEVNVEKPTESKDVFNDYLNLLDNNNPTDYSEDLGKAGIAAASTFDIPLNSGSQVKAKFHYSTLILNDIKTYPALREIADILEKAPFATTITTTTDNHDCGFGGTSAHCENRAVDIRTWDKTPGQNKALMEYLSGQECTDDLFYSAYPEYCRDAGKPYTGKSCSDHGDHIHYSVKNIPQCAGK